MLLLAINAFTTILILLFAIRAIVHESRNPLEKQLGRLVFVTVWNLVLLLVIAFAAWPISPWGQSQRDQVAKDFMTSLSAGDFESALDMISPAPDHEYSVIADTLSDPNNFPVSWEMNETNSRDISFGRASFPNGDEAVVKVFLTWEWEKARWGIDGVEFGASLSNGRPRFWLYETFIPYLWFRDGVIVVSIISALVSRKLYEDNLQREPGYGV